MSESPYDLDPTVAELQKKLARLDADHKEKRNRLLAAITALTGESTAVLSPELVISKELQNARMKAVDAAIKAMPDTFTTIELRDYISKNNAEHIVKATKGSYLPTRLTVIASNKRIKLVEKGENGLPNKWMKL